MSRRLSLPRRVSTAKEGLDFTTQVFRFCQDVLTFLEAAKQRFEAIDAGELNVVDDGIADALRTATTVVDVAAATAPTAGQVLTAVDDETATWQTPSPAGTVASELFTAPATAHALDDEFTDASLDAKWTFRDSTGATVVPGNSIDPYTTFASGDPQVELGRTGWSSWLQVQVEANNTNWTMCQPYAVPANMFIWCRHAAQRQVTVENNAGFCVISFFGDDGSGAPDLLQNQVYLGYNPNAASPRLEWGRYVAGVSTISQVSTDMGFAQGATYEYYAIQKIGTTYHGWAFGQGRAVAYLGSQTHAGTMAFVGFQFTDATVVDPGNTLISVDFFRAVDAASYLP